MVYNNSASGRPTSRTTTTSLSRSATTSTNITSVSGHTDFFSSIIVDSPFHDNTGIIIPDSALLRQLDEKNSFVDTDSQGLPSPSPFVDSHSFRPEIEAEHQSQHSYLPLRESETVVRGTAPLRVNKHKPRARVAPIGPARRRRGSTISLPRSPQSPLSPRSKRTSNTSSRDPHSAISHMFLSMPAISPSPTHQKAYHPPTRPAQNQRKVRVKDAMASSTKRSSRSSMELGLGQFETYDIVLPGPSPPMTPGLSPSKAFFSQHIDSLLYDVNVDGSNKSLPRPPAPSSPITPSRAPRKAAALLGASQTTASDRRYQQAMSKSTKSRIRSKPKPGNHFLPLPNAALTEIERFLGGAPAKPKPSSKSKSGLKTSKTASSTLEQNVNGRNVGEGKSMPYKGEDGNMWLDVEEEQEFAWLMGDIISHSQHNIPAPLPLPLISNNDGNDMNVLYEDTETEREEEWGMERFTSVLSLPKPKKSTTANVPRRAKGSEESFLDLDPPHHHYRRTPSNISSIPHPWSKNHIRSHSYPLPSPSPKTSTSGIGFGEQSLLRPALINEPEFQPIRHKQKHKHNNRERSISPPVLSNSDSEGTTCSGSGSSPTSKRKERPPPLTLPRLVPSSRLPVLTATTPGRPRATTSGASGASGREWETSLSKSEIPDTPFVRPRIAPKPLRSGSHSHSHSTSKKHNFNFEEALSIPVPPLPSTSTSTSTSKGKEPISFFEPVTPVKSRHTKTNASGNGESTTSDMGKSKNKGWFRKALAGVKV